MAKYIIQDREAGNIIDEFNTLEEAQQELEKYERQDKQDKCYSRNFYEIVERQEMSDLVTYIRDNLDELDVAEIDIAIDRMMQSRSPLSVVNPRIYAKIDNLVDEFMFNDGVVLGNADDIDIEDLIYEL